MKKSLFMNNIHHTLTSSLMRRGWVMLCLMLSLTACSTDDDENTGGNESVKTIELTPGNDQRPSWTEPDYSKFEFIMSIQVQLGDTLTSFQGAQDLMCATIDGEVRAVTPALSTAGELYYPLSIASNGANANISLSYYCDSLHRIYTINDWAVFNPSAAPTGDSGIYRPKFTATIK